MNKKRLENLSFIFSIFGLFSIIFFVIGIKNIDNYSNWFSFCILCVICGILLALIIRFFLCILEPKAKTYKNSKGFGFLNQLIFGFILTSFGALRLINEYKIRETECKMYKILDIGKSGSKTPQHFVFINGENGEERLSFGEKFNENHQAEDSINLCIHKGFLGFKFYETTRTKMLPKTHYN
ncbi:MAG: hypothetical protein ACK4M4_09775 [Flavobacterium sp.]